MNWIETVPFIVAAAIFLLLPGGLVAVAIGLRGLAAAAVAGPLTIAVAGVLAVLLPYMGLPWSSVAILFGGVALAVVLVSLRLWQRYQSLFEHLEWQPRMSRRSLLLALSFLVGAALILAQLMVAFGTPPSYSQTFDNVFHLNGVRYVLNTSNASSLTLSSMTSGGGLPYFYPAAWHGLAAALIQLTGLPLAVGVNVLNMAVAAVVWPLGAMLLTRVVAGNRPVAVGAAAVLAAGFGAFPILLLDFGVLYPNFLSISVLPASLASVALLFGVGRQLPVDPWARYGLPVLLIPGVALAHPNGFMSLLVLSVPIVLQSYWHRYLHARSYRERRRECVLATAGLVAAAVGFIVLWKFIRPPADAAFWGPIQSAPAAVVEVLTNSAMDRPLAPGISVLMLLGLLFSLRRPGRFWLLSCFAITAALFVVGSGLPIGPFRSRITGVWYNDSYRLAALLPLTALPFAALGVDGAIRWFNDFVRGSPPRFAAAAEGNGTGRPGIRAGLYRAVVGILAFALITSQVPSLAAAIESAQGNYREDADSPLVSIDEQAVLDHLPDLIPAGTVVAVNPWTGAALAYALADRDTTAKHVLTANSKDVELLNARLRDAGTDPAVCEAIRRTGVHYVLDFGTKEVHGGNHTFPGLAGLDASTSVQLVFRQGNASLYEVTACGDS